MKTLVVGIESGRFTVRASGTKVGDCELKPKALGELLASVNFDPRDDQLMCSSSVDFPEDDGAPKGFDGRKAVSEASALCAAARNKKS